MNLLPDDPKITAYALGELEGEARAEVEAAIAADDQLRKAVEQIRATGAQLAGALAGEAGWTALPALSLSNGLPNAVPPESALGGSALHRAAIIPGRDFTVLDGGPASSDGLRRAGDHNIFSFPRMYYVIAGVAAACFALLIAVRQPSGSPYGRKALTEETDLRNSRTIELPLAPLAPALTLPASSSVVIQVPPDKEAPPPAFSDQVKANQVVVPATAPAPVQMNPFVVITEQDKQFQSTAVGVGGSRLRLDLSDTPVSYSVINREFVQTLGIANMAEAASWAGAPSREQPGSESYGVVRTNQFINVADQEMSTFSIDVDSASYANVRRFIDNGQLPPRDAVRVEELVNYFPYKYANPAGNLPFGTTIEAASTPWEPEHRLVRIAIKGKDIEAAARPRANLVFLLDVSGSMNEPNKLPLVKDSMRLLLRRLREDDRVAIVVYAGDSGVALPSTPASRSAEIANAIDSLRAGGSTNGASGIRLAYDIAQENFIRGGVNRVILCTDGDFNVGVTSQGDLTRLIEDRAKSNVFLTVLGFGMGNLKDSTLELLADKGNGNYGYIDSRREAEKLLVEQITSTLVTIAKDVKIQVVFNPAQVAAYRLIGYENRLLAAQDFNNDKVDAGEIGAGHTVTALYEVVLAHSEGGGTITPSPYRSGSQAVGGQAGTEAARVAAAQAAANGRPPTRAQQLRDRELFTLRIRYKDPTGDASPDSVGASRLQEFPFTDTDRDFNGASEDFRFATAVAAFGMALRGDTPQQGMLGQAITWAENSLGTDNGGYRREFVDLARRARTLIR